MRCGSAPICTVAVGLLLLGGGLLAFDGDGDGKSSAAQETTEQAAQAAAQESPPAETSSAEREALRRQLEDLRARQREIEGQYRDAQREIEQRYREVQRSMQEQLEAARQAVREREQSEVDRGQRDDARRKRSIEDRSSRRERGDRSDQKFAIGSTVKVNRGEVAADIFALGGGVKIDGEVRGGAVAIGGEIKVNGRVTGDVVSFGRDVELGEAAEVLGNVVSIGGDVERADGARVGGEISEVGLSPGFDLGNGDWWGWNGWSGSWGDRGRMQFDEWLELFWALTSSMLLLVLSGVVLLVVPEGVEQVRRASMNEPWKAMLVGLGVELLSLPALIVIAILLVVSLIGIPLLVFLPFLILLLLAAALYGYTALAVGVGRWLSGRFGWGTRSRFGALLIGVVAIQGLSLSGTFLDAIGLPILIWGLFSMFGFLVKFLVWTTGLGGAVMTRFGAGAATPPLPPLPQPAARAY